MKILRTKTTWNEFPLKYLKVLNGTLKLTDKESELTAEIIKEYLKYGSQGLQEPFLSKFVFSTEGRKSICDNLNGLSTQNLGNKLQQLLDKGVLVKDEAGFSLSNRLLPELEITFKFEIVDDATGEVLREDSEETQSE